VPALQIAVHKHKMLGRDARMQVCLEHFHRNVYGAAADNPGSEIGRSGTPFFGGLTVMSLSLAENGDLTANRNRFASERPEVSN
jgi:hypothetical protein